MKRLKAATLLLLALALTAGIVLAHDTWLLPERFTAAVNTPLFLDLTSGMAFPNSETSIKPERIDKAQYRLGGQVEALSDFSSAPKSLRLKAELSQVGVATIWVELKPRALELTPAQVQDYFGEIGAPASLRREWAMTKEPKRWREVYTKHAKTFVQVGDTSDRSWAEPVGMAFEIVPEKDPTRLKRGEIFPVRLLANGQPLINFPLGIVRAGSAKGQTRKTDAEGRVRFLLARSGRWLLRCTKLRKSTQTNVEWESDFSTLTVNVK